MSASELLEAVEGRAWYHTIDLGDGLTTPGWFDTRSVVEQVPFPPDLRGRRGLDVGTFDGFWAFEMERRGAEEVIAVDVPDPADWDWPPSAPEEVRREIASRHLGGGGFDIAHRALGSRVRKVASSIYHLEPDDIGEFDFVYVGSLLLHLRDPVGALDRVRRVCRGRMLLVDAIDWWLSLRAPRRPLASLDGRDRPWWWKPNVAGIVRMVESAGFRLEVPPVRVTMPPGAGQVRAPLAPRSFASPEGREALVRSRIGDPHVAVLAEPAV